MVQKTVLLVEDDPEDARLLQEVLSQVAAEVQVHHAQDGAAANDFLQASLAENDLPLLVVLDLHLGAEHGADLLTEWRNHPRLRELAVAVLTSSSHERDIESARAAQATSYYLKPGDMDEYMALAKDLVVFWLEAPRK